MFGLFYCLPYNTLYHFRDWSHGVERFALSECILLVFVFCASQAAQSCTATKGETAAVATTAATNLPKAFHSAAAATSLLTAYHSTAAAAATSLVTTTYHSTAAVTAASVVHSCGAGYSSGD